VADGLAAEVPDPHVDRMVTAATVAQEVFAAWAEDRVDALLEDMARTLTSHADELARLVVEETTIGNVPDKVLKIEFASLGVYGSLAGRPGRGVLDHDRRRKTTQVASPVGVVFALIPVTSPVATLVDNVLIALKGRNALIASCHRRARRSAERTVALMEPVLARHGAPRDLVQVVGLRASRQTTARFMRHPGVALILATGGRDMVAAAYSAGKPAIGVGPGNAPAWICADADLEAAAQAVVNSKAFDNGLVCGAEQHLVVDRAVVDPFVARLEAEGAAVLDAEESRRFTEAAFDRGTGDLHLWLVGRSAAELMAAAELRRDHEVRLVVFRADRDRPEGAAARERLAPAVSRVVVDDDDQALALSRRLIEHEGAGHTAVVHTADEERVQRFTAEVPGSRILVNVPASLGCCGVLTGLDPSFTLGCGTRGGNSTTDNVGYRHLVNVQRVARMQYDNLLLLRRLVNRRPAPVTASSDA
jgi:acyl-CoA reductase-like NAD-dependent aldehyde dehydrogenase